jgi:hypothetical protein
MKVRAVRERKESGIVERRERKKERRKKKKEREKRKKKELKS